MKVSKTKELLINTARELFAEKGVNNTTMNDISVRSGKGRRTLYVYFKSKEEVYTAVIEQELALLINNLEVIVNKDINPERKIIEYIVTRLNTINEIVNRNGSLRSVFFNNILEVTKARQKINSYELAFLRRILQEGINKKVFAVDNVEIASQMILYALQGIEVPYTRVRIRERLRRNKNGIVRFFLRSLKQSNQ
ncbi:MAG: TetR/AcrR family transcriptional regulator [Bacteroidales bacterium]|nr:TetR/AcrR family transcriptional regulator [Bacteroidales bacterium]MBR6309624.1 TetR/AcrR family transcriptional regulator [Paludibacteraceae bacterium]